MALDTGTLIDERYTLYHPLDRGGMGTVWVAHDRLTRQHVAIKFIRQSTLSDEATRRFRREAKALLKLKHPNVVELLGRGVIGDVPFIAMELVQGESLRNRLKRERSLPPWDAIALLQQAAAGLAAAHALGIVHRDIKPSNLVISSDPDGDRLKVIDFGIAAGKAISTVNGKLTFGSVGTPPYMSPEQVSGEGVDHLADVWSLSVVAFELLTGRRPFAGGSVPETLDLICSGVSPRASAVAGGLPAGVDGVFQRAFAQTRSERWPNAPALVAELSRVYAGAANVRAVEPAPNSGRDTATDVMTPKPILRHSDGSHCYMWFDNAQLVVSLAWPSRALLRQSLAELERLARTLRRKIGLLVILKSQVEAPDVYQQDELQQELLSSTCIAAAAYVVEGTGASGAALWSALSQLKQVTPNAFSLEIFGEASSGARWLAAELQSRTGKAPAAGELSQVAHDLRGYPAQPILRR